MKRLSLESQWRTAFVKKAKLETPRRMSVLKRLVRDGDASFYPTVRVNGEFLTTVIFLRVASAVPIAFVLYMSLDEFVSEMNAGLSEEDWIITGWAGNPQEVTE